MSSQVSSLIRYLEDGRSDLALANNLTKTQYTTHSGTTVTSHTMASLLGISESRDLITAISVRLPANIPNLRLVCRQLHHATISSFRECFLEELTVLAHPASIEVLNDIASDSRYRSAVRKLIIDVHGVFPRGKQKSHRKTIKDGIIREGLVKALSNLPMCLVLETPRFFKDMCPRPLGFRQVDRPFLRHRKDVYLEKWPSTWMSSAAFAYPSYVMCEILHALSHTKHQVKHIPLGHMMIEYGVLRDYLAHAPIPAQGLNGIKGFSILVSDDHWDENPCSSSHVTAEMVSHHPPSQVLQDLIDKMPRLEVLMAWNTMEKVFLLPALYPPNLRCLALHNSDTHTLAINLQGLTQLEGLKLFTIGFESVEACQALLHTISELPSLHTFYFEPLLGESFWEPEETANLVTEDCSKLIEFHSTLTTRDAAHDTVGWAAALRVCHCGTWYHEGEFADYSKFDGDVELRV